MCSFVFIQQLLTRAAPSDNKGVIVILEEAYPFVMSSAHRLWIALKKLKIDVLVPHHIISYHSIITDTVLWSS